jgi:uroporphyrin-III C-methyltransferase/precorrin-2 dehydrogenase/sirohydrochlorin ferrochelatase
MSASGLPLLLDLTGRRVVIVGGGPIAARRLTAALDGGADDVVVVTLARGTHLSHVLARPEAGAVRVLDRAFEDADLDGTWLALACTDSADVNALVAAAAHARRVFCVRSDRSVGGSARIPAIARIGDVTVAVNANDDPVRASALRNAIALAAQLGQLPTGRRRGAAAGGRVALVGGGPGDPELITVRGRRLLAEAQVVVVDRLAPRELLAQLARDVEVIDCGKSPHRHNMTQDQINTVIVDRARAGLRVVRLKGGDPFVFGRGGEEVEACVAAGVPVEVVPGVSSALAAPASMGVPVTHRGLSSDVTIVSGHLDPGSPDDVAAGGPDWTWLATGPSTLVLLMAMGRLEAIGAELIRRGRDPLTPAAVVQNATTPRERFVRAPLRDLAKAAADAGLSSPAVVIVGAVAALG